MNSMGVIYITGLGDNNPLFQKLAVKTWSLYGVTPVFFQSNWDSEETFDAKLRRLCELIDEVQTKTQKRVGLIAASAGVSMALHAYAQRANKVAGVVSICGKIGRPDYVLDSVRQRSPSFSQSMNRLPKSLSLLSQSDRQRVMCVVPLIDKIVDTQDQVLDGALYRRAWSVGHVVTIVLQITLAAKKNCKFLLL